MTALALIVVCANCGQPIVKPYSDGRPYWEHEATGSPYCQMPTFAKPRAGEV